MGRKDQELGVPQGRVVKQTSLDILPRLVSHLRSEGLEPPTYKFVACCSIQLSYDRKRDPP